MTDGRARKPNRLRQKIEKFRADLKAVDVRVAEIERRDARRKARQAKQQTMSGDEETVVHCTATIAGNVANSIVNNT
jgi:hypothetical protein